MAKKHEMVYGILRLSRQQSYRCLVRTQLPDCFELAFVTLYSRRQRYALLNPP